MENKFCETCRTQFDDGFHADHGGDCLLCMARFTDPDCEAKVLALAIEYIPKLLYVAREAATLPSVPEVRAETSYRVKELLRKMGARDAYGEMA